jgi:hypothetical protein
MGESSIYDTKYVRDLGMRLIFMAECGRGDGSWCGGLWGTQTTEMIV